ncbi:HEAT repeat domain-containing protein [Actinocorallia longicatena]|uniref:HEAT repeat protein n=1 Tax=Actinocorallia longicatena TaxID=111803 RepID=A0ABP6QCW1_9ACTN
MSTVPVMGVSWTVAAVCLGLLLATVALVPAAYWLRDRRGRRRWQRAARVRPLLLRLAAEGDDEEELLAELGRVGPRTWRAARPQLVSLLYKTRGSAQAGLAEVMEQRGEMRRLLAATSGWSPLLRRRAAHLLGAAGWEPGRNRLTFLLRDADPEVRAAAALALGRIGDPRSARPLLKALAGHRPVGPDPVAAALVRLGPAAAPQLRAGLESPQPRARSTSAAALGVLGGPRDVRELLSRLEREEEADVRVAILGALGRLGSPASAGAISARLGDHDPAVRRAAAEALGELGAGSTAEALRAALDDPDPANARAAADALLRLEGS